MTKNCRNICTVRIPIEPLGVSIHVESGCSQGIARVKLIIDSHDNIPSVTGFRQGQLDDNTTICYSLFGSDPIFPPNSMHVAGIML